LKDKTLETKGSGKEKAFEITIAAKERLGSTLQTTKDKSYEIVEFVKEKASETTTAAKEPLISHVHTSQKVFILHTSNHAHMLTSQKTLQA
jgi:gas vesicle protein